MSLHIEITKRDDGGAMLRCTRADGSVSWQRQQGRQARFFPLHDLAHFVVETELRARLGFYGLIADGWAIDETTGKTARGALPAETLLIERIVGSLDVERSGGVPWSADDFNAMLAAAASEAHLPPPPVLTDAQLDRIRTRTDELHAQWFALSPDSTLELHFERD